MQSEREILKGFLRGEGEAFRELLTKLRPTCLSILLKEHRNLLHAHDDILDAVETTLLDWRAKHLAGDERFDTDQSLSALAWRLAKQEAKQESRYSKRTEVTSNIGEKMSQLSSPSNADDSARLQGLMNEIQALPEDMATTLLAEAQRVLNEAPPLEAQLGVSPAAARKRLERARRELRLRLLGTTEDD